MGPVLAAPRGGRGPAGARAGPAAEGDPAAGLPGSRRPPRLVGVFDAGGPRAAEGAAARARGARARAGPAASRSTPGAVCPPCERQFGPVGAATSRAGLLAGESGRRSGMESRPGPRGAGQPPRMARGPAQAPRSAAGAAPGGSRPTCGRCSGLRRRQRAGSHRKRARVS